MEVKLFIIIVPEMKLMVDYSCQANKVTLLIIDGDESFSSNLGFHDYSYNIMYIVPVLLLLVIVFVS